MNQRKHSSWVYPPGKKNTTPRIWLLITRPGQIGALTTNRLSSKPDLSVPLGVNFSSRKGLFTEQITSFPGFLVHSFHINPIQEQTGWTKEYGTNKGTSLGNSGGVLAAEYHSVCCSISFFFRQILLFKLPFIDSNWHWVEMRCLLNKENPKNSEGMV